MKTHCFVFVVSCLFALVTFRSIDSASAETDPTDLLKKKGTPASDPAPKPTVTLAPVSCQPAVLQQCQNDLLACNAGRKAMEDAAAAWIAQNCPAAGNDNRLKTLGDDGLQEKILQKRPPKKPRPTPPKTPRKAPEDPKPKPDVVKTTNAKMVFVIVGDSPTAATSDEAKRRGCKNGANRWPIGVDWNGNGELDKSEIGPRGSITICNPEKGEPGKPGQDALFDIEKHGQCTRFISWVDTDHDSKRTEKDQVRSSREICPPDRLDGRPGRDGTSVYLGLTFSYDHLRVSNGGPVINTSGACLSLGLQRSAYEATLRGCWSPGKQHGSSVAANVSVYVLKDVVGFQLGLNQMYHAIDSGFHFRFSTLMVEPGVVGRVFDGRHLKVRVGGHVGIGAESIYGDSKLTLGVGGFASALYAW